MNKDFRVAVDYFTHPKTIKAARALGDLAPYAFLRLMSHAAVNKSSGVLSGMDAEDIAIAAGWSGEPAALVEAWVRIGQLERMADDTLAIHDWLDHNPYAASSEERSQKARRAAQKRHHGTTEQSDEQEGAMLNPASSMRVASPSNAPSPSPDPDPSPYQNQIQNHLPPTPNVHASAHEASASAEGREGSGNVVHFSEAVAERTNATEPEAPPVAAAPPRREPPARYAPDFERFWREYPKKVGKFEASKHFAALRRQGVTVDEMLAGLERWKASDQWTKDGGTFVPDPERWLKRRLFGPDEAPPVARALPVVLQGGRPAGPYATSDAAIAEYLATYGGEEAAL